MKKNKKITKVLSTIQIWGDLRISRIQKSERDMKLLLEMLEIHCRYPFAFDAGDLCIISTGAVLTPSAELDMLNAQSEREKAYEQLMEARLSETATENFFDRLPKMKLQTFSPASRSRRQLKTVETKLFRKPIKISLIAQTRHLRKCDNIR